MCFFLLNTIHTVYNTVYTDAYKDLYNEEIFCMSMAMMLGSNENKQKKSFKKTIETSIFCTSLSWITSFVNLVFSPMNPHFINRL